MAKKKASSKAPHEVSLSKKQKEQQIKTFSMAAMEMAMAEDQTSLDSASSKASKALLKLWGGSMEAPKLLLALELGLRSAKKGMAAGHLAEGIEEGVRQGRLRELPGGLIDVAAAPALEPAKTNNRPNLNCYQSAGTPDGGTPSSLPVAAETESSLTPPPSTAWAVESLRPPCDIGIPWEIEEEAPRWPDGTRMYHSDEGTLTKAVAEVLRAVHPSGKFDDNPHYCLAYALERALYEGGAAGEGDDVLDHCYLSMAFLAGVAWAKKNHAIGKPPVEQEPGFAAGLLDIEPERESAAEFRKCIGIIRIDGNFDERFPHLKAELRRVELRGDKPSPELLDALELRLVAAG